MEFTPEPITESDCHDLQESTKSMGHHWVPQYYLKGFAVTDTEDRLWQFDKQTQEFSTAPIPAKKLAQQKNYNETLVENTLANAVENPANAILDRLRQGQRITLAEKRIFAQYLGTMLFRVPSHRRSTAEMYPEVLDGLIHDVSGAIDQMRASGASPKQIALRRAELVDAQRNLEAQIPPEAIEAINNPFPDKGVIGGIHAMNWYLVKATGTQQFVTSDNPMFAFRCWGVGNPKSEFCFPISTSIGLFGSYHPAKWWLSYSAAHVAQANKRIISDAGRFVYSSMRYDWINEYCDTPPEKLKRLVPP